ncbi:hypothetical protein [Brevundimonas denitrificans]|uniref:hypothetical protein n=1 Tax=Brevundimonas denitrificans TaxID=1443434 RepID=UPI00223A6DEE|nr:hypothetical protein [Brevundimonas denitrificans]
MSVLALGLAAQAATAQDWRAAAEQDLTAAREALSQNHPAAVIEAPSSARFRTWLDEGYAEAQGNLGRVNSPNAYAYLLRGYGYGFRDANISLGPTWEGREPWDAVAWANFATAWRDGAYVVTWVKDGVRRTFRRWDGCWSPAMEPRPRKSPSAVWTAGKAISTSRRTASRRRPTCSGTGATPWPAACPPNAASWTAVAAATWTS